MSVTDVVEVTIPSFNIIIMERKLKQWWSTIHQYQQNEQPPLTSNHWKKKTTQTLVLDWNRQKKVAGFNRLMGSQSFSS